MVVFQTGIGSAFRYHFHTLFQSIEPQFPEDFQHLITNSITPDMNSNLLTIPAVEEIHRIVFEMGNYKSPGPDDMTVVFYKTYRNIVKEAVILEIQRFFTTVALKPAYNHTFIALIPKTSHPSRVDQYSLV